MFFVLLVGVHGKSRSQEDTTVEHAASRGLAPTFLGSVGGRPRSRREGFLPPHNQVTVGFVRDLGDRDGRQSAGAPQAGQLESVTTMRCAPIASLGRDQRGGNDPAGVAFFRAGAGEPIPTRTRCIDQHAMFALRLQWADELVKIALARANGTKVADLGVECLGDIGNGNRVFLDSHADGERARLWQGGPPRVLG